MTRCAASALNGIRRGQQRDFSGAPDKLPAASSRSTAGAWMACSTSGWRYARLAQHRGRPPQLSKPPAGGSRMVRPRRAEYLICGADAAWAGRGVDSGRHRLTDAPVVRVATTLAETRSRPGTDLGAQSRRAAGTCPALVPSGLTPAWAGLVVRKRGLARDELEWSGPAGSVPDDGGPGGSAAHLTRRRKRGPLSGRNGGAGSR